MYTGVQSAVHFNPYGCHFNTRTKLLKSSVHSGVESLNSIGSTTFATSGCASSAALRVTTT